LRALVSERPGDGMTLCLRTVPNPAPAAGEVLIAVEACGVNYPDVLIIQDLYQFRPERPFSPGSEVVGRVLAVGPGVTEVKAGDRVVAGVGWGGMAEQVVAPENRCFPLPANIPAETAAGLLMTYGTSQHALKDRAALKAGETLLVLGAAGGVGLAAVELGKIIGARVIAAVSTPAKAEVARARGADATLVYPTVVDSTSAKALAAEFKSACGSEGAHVIYDGVGGAYAEPALRAIAWLGRYLVVGFPAGIPKIPLNLPLLKGCSVVGVFWGAFIARCPERHRANIAELLQLCAAGNLRPLISERYSLEQGGAAIARLASRNAVGKIVVTVP
jgi:NADPH2:quinone reductase